MYPRNCETCCRMAASEYGLEEPHEAHAYWICTGCGSYESDDYSFCGWIASEAYCKDCYEAYCGYLEQEAQAEALYGEEN